MKQFHFTSKLSSMMELYLATRNEDGFLTNNSGYYLQELDALSKETGNESFVTRELIEVWDTVKPHLSNRTKIQRHNIIRSFAAFAYAHDGMSYVPYTSKLKSNSSFVPHIFTTDEISRLFYAADNLPYRKNAPTRHLVIPAVMRLLYACGLRVNEALRLRTIDVDFDAGVITIFNGKGGKDRLIPIHSSLTEYLKEYTEKLPSNREWFFPSASGHYSSGAVYENFRELLFQSHIPHTGNGPRVHDFRHTFAVHTLEKQLAEGYDPMVILPRLAAYLGHKSYRETCWYIHLTIASFPELAQRLDSAFMGIIPVVGGEMLEED
ncbi:MAG: tyrosine-type recombinase/integrase [Anaerovoracaceae bacterium]